MESAPQSGIALIIHTSVVSIEHLDRIKSIYPVGDEKEKGYRTTIEDLGWYVLFSGSHERLYVGEENPGFAQGDEVEIVIRKKPSCPPSQTTNPTNTPSS